jgi:hypothetical protein
LLSLLNLSAFEYKFSTVGLQLNTVSIVVVNSVFLRRFSNKVLNVHAYADEQENHMLIKHIVIVHIRLDLLRVLNISKEI